LLGLDSFCPTGYNMIAGMNLSPTTIRLVRRMSQSDGKDPREWLDHLLLRRDAWPRLKRAIQPLESESDEIFLPTHQEPLGPL